MRRKDRESQKRKIKCLTRLPKSRPDQNITKENIPSQIPKGSSSIDLPKIEISDYAFVLGW